MKIVKIGYEAHSKIYSAGFQGDHNAVKLIIEPPKQDNVSYYRLDWQLPDGVFKSQNLFPQADGTIEYLISSELTKNSGFVSVQLKAFWEEGGELIRQSGTNVLLLFIGESING